MKLCPLLGGFVASDCNTYLFSLLKLRGARFDQGEGGGAPPLVCDNNHCQFRGDLIIIMNMTPCFYSSLLKFNKSRSSWRVN